MTQVELSVLVGLRDGYQQILREGIALKRLSPEDIRLFQDRKAEVQAQIETALAADKFGIVKN